MTHRWTESDLVARWLAIVIVSSAMAAPTAAFEFPRSPEEPGPYIVARSEVTVVNERRLFFKSMDGIVYYPATEAVPDAPVDRSGAPYPGFSFGHGMSGPVDSYDDLLSHIASWGYVVVSVGYSDASTVSQAAGDLQAGLDFFEAESVDLSSIWYASVDTRRFALGGHSYGGAASLLGSMRDDRVDAVVTVSAFDPVPSLAGRMDEIDGAVLMIGGNCDAVTPLRWIQRPLYDGAEAPRALLKIDGGTHSGYQDDGEGLADAQGTGCPGEIERSLQRRISGLYIAAHLDLHLKGNEERRSYLYGGRSADDLRAGMSWESGDRLDVVMRLDGEVVRGGDSVPVKLELHNRTTATGRVDLVRMDVAPAGPSRRDVPLAVLGPEQSTEILHVQRIPDGVPDGVWRVEMQARIVTMDDAFSVSKIFEHREIRIESGKP